MFTVFVTCSSLKGKKKEKKNPINTFRKKTKKTMLATGETAYVFFYSN